VVEGDRADGFSLRLEPRDGAPLDVEARGFDDHHGRIVDGGGTDEHVALLVPSELLRALRQWYHGGSHPGVLAIVSRSAALDMIPWERLPRAVGLPDVCIVRLVHDAAPAGPEPADGPGALLVVGWVGAPLLNLPGVEKELVELAQLRLPAGVQMAVMAEPTLAELHEAWARLRPRCLHIAAPAVVYESGPRIAISGIEDLQLVPIDEFLAGMDRTRDTRLVLLNSCDGASGRGQPSIARILAERMGAVTISWYGAVDDLEAVDFARFFYSRLLEGDTAVEGLRAFNRIRSLSSPPDRPTRGLTSLLDARTLPVLWTPSLEALVEAPFPGRDGPSPPRGGEARRGAPPHDPASAPRSEREPAVSIDFEPQRWLNPALLTNRRPAILRLVLNADRPLDGVGVAITCDAGLGQSTVASTQDLKGGPQPIQVDDLHFPILYQLIEHGAERRWVNFTLRCTHGSAVLAETTRSVLWMGLSEWLDRKDMWHFIPAFVDPNAEGVLKVLDEGTVLLKKLVAPTSAFSGYQSGDHGFVRRQVEAIFNCLRDEPFGLSYINVPPLEVYVPGDATPSGQRVRTPTQVIERRRGTCHDLAILLASCLEHVGIHPLVILKPGHTYTGFWTDYQAHEDFWSRARRNPLRLQQVGGRDWSIGSQDELRTLVSEGNVLLLEATCVTDRNALFEGALAQGLAHIDPSQDFDVAIDVRASRHSVQPL
jgi:hypothetical protein